MMDVCLYHDNKPAVADAVDARTCKILHPVCDECATAIVVTNSLLMLKQKPVKFVQLRIPYGTQEARG